MDQFINFLAGVAIGYVLIMIVLIVVITYEIGKNKH